ncbi:MAG: carboxypeptidase regulatory-like domain-containing protein [Micromonosporaceae bacterium]|nr:carboxypeptidase regulatory-like domain-containing protein [Micromonosporaceae bacterium]
MPVAPQRGDQPYARFGESAGGVPVGHGAYVVLFGIQAREPLLLVGAVEVRAGLFGTVENTIGEPIEGATVTLLRSDTQTGTYTVVPNGSTIMSPDNRTNPDLTDANGGYRWDVAPGWYKVRAEKAGCTAPGSSATFVESPPKQVAVGLPPVTDLVLVLYCGEEIPPGPEPPSNVDVQIRQTTSWNSDTGGGYCAEIIATNHSSAPVVWAANVTLPGNIYTAWNFNRQSLVRTVTTSRASNGT